MSRTCARACSMPCELSTTKSARRRFSASGICLRQQRVELLLGHAGRSSTRARCISAGADTTTIASTRLLAAGLEQQRNVEHHDRRAARFAPRARNAVSRLRAPADARSLPAARSAGAIAEHRAGRACARSTLPSVGRARETPPRSAAPPRRRRARARPRRRRAPARPPRRTTAPSWSCPCDRAGETDDEHGARLLRADSPRRRSQSSSGSSGRPRTVKWSPSTRSNS